MTTIVWSIVLFWSSGFMDTHTTFGTKAECQQEAEKLHTDAVRVDCWPKQSIDPADWGWAQPYPFGTVGR